MPVEFVLDTNIVAAFMARVPRVIDSVAAHGAATVAIPQPVLAELAFGVERMPTSKRRRELEAQLDRVLDVFGRVAWTDDVTAEFARIKTALERRGEIIEDFDIAIAAHALSLNAVLVTANVKHMRRVPGLHVEDWTR